MKDLLTNISLESYVKAIMKMPLSEDESPYNRRSGEVGDGRKAAAVTKKFGTYRSLRHRVNRMKLEIAEETAYIAAAEERGRAMGRARHILTGKYIELGKLTVRCRELEEMCEKIEDEFAREVVRYRYFEDLHRRLPSWADTAKELGIGISGEELRRYVAEAVV
jgi:hypothetical protein